MPKINFFASEPIPGLGWRGGSSGEPTLHETEAELQTAWHLI